MPFANPFLVLGAIGGAIPVVIHLLNRRRFKIVRWAAMEFLLASLRKNFRRVRFESLLLLLLRILMVVLMALALARPRISESGLIGALGTESRHAILVLDNSLSMRYRDGRQTCFEKAKQTAGRILETLSQGDVVSLLAMSDIIEPVIKEASLDVELTKREIKRLEPGWGGTDARAALLAAADLIGSTRKTRKDLFLLTDLQAGAWGEPGREPSPELNAALDRIRKDAKVFLVDAGAKEPANVAVTRLVPRFKVIGVGSPAEFEVDVTNHGPAKQSGVQVSFLVDKFKLNVENVDIRPGDTVTTTFRYSFRKKGVHVVQAELGDDRLREDNVRHLAVRVEEFIPVLLVNGETSGELEENETYCIERALNPPTEEGAPRVSNLRPETVTEFGLSAVDFGRYRLVVLANLASLPAADTVSRLEDYVRRGGALLVFLGDRVDARFYNTRLFKDGQGLLPARLGPEVGRLGEDRKGVRIELTRPVHPGFGLFAGDRAIFLKRILFYKYFELEMPKDTGDVRMAAVFETGKPAVLERSFGRGRVVLFASSADAEWNNFPGLAAYPVVINDLASELATGDFEQRNLLVHQPYRRTFAPEELVESVAIRAPGQASAAEKLKPYPVRAAAPSAGGAPAVTEILFRKTRVAGTYELETERKEGDRPPIEYFAVNPPAEESNLRRITPEQLKERLKGLEFKYATGADELKLAVRQSRTGREFARPLLIALLCIACVELVLAKAFGKG